MKRLIALCLALAAATTAFGGDGSKLEDLPRLTVRGEAVLHKPADQLRLRVAVVTEAEEAPAAVSDNTTHMEAVIAALKKVGLDETEYQTGRFSITPRYSRPPRGATDEWVRRIIGYEVSNSLSIRTKKLDLAGKIIQAANNAGANSIDAITFDLANPRTHRAEAIAAATGNARSDAAILARAADLRLVRILTITLDQNQATPPGPQMLRAEAAYGVAATPPPIQPGDVPVRASVTIVYEIAPSQ